MKGNIAVVGMGQGGMVAAYKLAQAGYSVTIYDKEERGFVSHDWSDDIATDVFEITNMPFPDKSVYFQKEAWAFVPPNYSASVLFPQRNPLADISVYRRNFSEYFINLCESVGCACVFGQKIEKLYVENERVCGIYTKDGIVKYDLIIDASGMYSIIRGQVPDKFGIQKVPKKTDTLYAYRAFYSHKEGTKTLRGDDASCTLYVKPHGTEGISWCNLNPDRDEVDILITQMQSLPEKTIDEIKKDLIEKNPIVGDKLLQETHIPICLRCSIASPVADGYVAIGDSAFMTIPVMGSGIETAMKGGAWLAEQIINNKIEDFTAANMWGFYVKYMKKLGAAWVFLDLLRRWALRLDGKLIDWALGSGIFVDEDAAFVTLEKDNPRKAKFRLFHWIKKLFMAIPKTNVIISALGLACRGIKGFFIALNIPKKYKLKKVQKWINKYNNVIDKVEAKALKKKK